MGAWATAAVAGRGAGSERVAGPAGSGAADATAGAATAAGGALGISGAGGGLLGPIETTRAGVSEPTTGVALRAGGTSLGTKAVGAGGSEALCAGESGELANGGSEPNRGGMLVLVDQLGGRADVAEDGGAASSTSPKPGKLNDGSPRQSFHTSVPSGGRIGRFTNT